MAGFSVGYGYGSSAISTQDPLLQHPRKKPVLWFSLFLLLALAFTCILPSPSFFLSKPKPHQEGDITSSCISIATFPQVCMSSLLSSSLLKHHTMGNVGLSIAKLATEEAMLGAHHLHSLSSALKSDSSLKDVRSTSILNDCEEVLDRSFEHVMLALHDLAHMHPHDFSNERVSEIRTWLSASLAFHTTCTDELATLHNTSLSPLKTGADYTGKLISNALAFVTSLHIEAPSITNWVVPFHARRALNGQNLPSWLSDLDSTLLQAITPTPDVTVAADGSGNYKSIQAAVNDAPQRSNKRYVIYIKKGVYNEQVDIPKTATNLMFVGDGVGATIITGSKNVQQPGVTTFTSATVAVNGNGFLARGVTFRNTAGAANHQAVALRVSADKVAFYKCSMEAYQDTLYTHTLRQFYRECDIYGTVDYIFGDSAAVFQNCNLKARVPMNGQQNIVTAQGRTDRNSNTGLSFQSCNVDGTPDLVKVISQYPTYLGRPWKEYSRTVFLKSYESGVINPAGWLPWDGDFALKTLFYGEYLCTGPGAAAAKRVSWSTQVTSASVANQYNAANFIDATNWLPSTSFPYDAGL